MHTANGTSALLQTDGFDKGFMVPKKYYNVYDRKHGSSFFACLLLPACLCIIDHTICIKVRIMP